jgi:hypothetical protein
LDSRQSSGIIASLAVLASLQFSQCMLQWWL